MPSLSIKDVPEPVAQRLRARAQRNHRSLQGELMAIIETAAYEPPGNMTRALDGSAAGDPDALLADLDAIVAGSTWGSAPLLTREAANTRATR